MQAAKMKKTAKKQAGARVGRGGGEGGKGGRVNKKKSKQKPSSRQMNQLSSAKKPQVQNSSGQPAAAAEEKRCRRCDVPHALSIDCPHFLTLATTKRAGYTHSLGGCLACLTTNHSIIFKKRMEWFSRHSNECDMSYVCTVGDCVKKQGLSEGACHSLRRSSPSE